MRSLVLACPVDRLVLDQVGNSLRCHAGHEYAIVDGIPVLLRDDVPPTHGAMSRSLDAGRCGMRPKYWTRDEVAEGIDPLVQRIVGATNGNLYNHAVGCLRDYPIPGLRLPNGNGVALLDIGCNWGRWSIAAARKGYDVVGLDPDLEALLAASRVAHSLGHEVRFVCGDARYLPFTDHSFERVFSYSVIQHFKKEDAESALREIGRILSSSGQSLIQMPNAFGVRSLYHQARRGFRRRSIFDVRYWTPRELSRAFASLIGPTSMSVDGFFGLGIQASDIGMLPFRYRAVVHASETFRLLSKAIPPLTMMADSLYMSSRRSLSR